MTVYVDDLRDWGWKLGRSCHMLADTNEELHRMAGQLGLRRAFFQKGSAPHYDLTTRKRRLAISFGAVEISDEQAVEFMRAWTAAAVARVNAATTEEEKRLIREDLFR